MCHVSCGSPPRHFIIGNQQSAKYFRGAKYKETILRPFCWITHVLLSFTALLAHFSSLVYRGSSGANDYLLQSGLQAALVKCFMTLGLSYHNQWLARECNPSQTSCWIYEQFCSGQSSDCILLPTVTLLSRPIINWDLINNQGGSSLSRL